MQMQEILEKVDEEIQQVERKQGETEREQEEEVVKNQSKANLLRELIKRTREKKIILRTENPRESLKIAQRAVYLGEGDRITWMQMIDLTQDGNKEWGIKDFTKGRVVGKILQKALEGKVKIEIKIE